MNRPIVKSYVTVVAEPTECVLKPIFVIYLRKILSRMGAATFHSSNRRMKADARLGQHVVKLERFGEIGVKDH